MRRLALGLTFLPLTACFDGSDALHLPCRTDDDCGRGQSCDQGFCDGPAPTTSASDTGTAGSSGSTGLPEPECGNGEIEAGEECDRGPDNAELADCTLQCRNALFFDDMSNANQSESAWRTEPPTMDWVINQEGWEINAMQDEALDLRLFFDGRLPLPSLNDIGPNGVVELIIEHDFTFQVCQGSSPDGAQVLISVDGGPEQLLTPSQGYAGTIGDAMCMPPSPLAGAAGFTGANSRGPEARFDLTFVLRDQPAPFRILLHTVFDCGQCDMPEVEANSWRIETAAVVPTYDPG